MADMKTLQIGKRHYQADKGALASTDDMQAAAPAPQSAILKERYINWINKGVIKNTTARKTAVRIKRSISWLQKAEEEGKDDDAKVIFLWIAFNALYGIDEDSDERLSETTRREEFLENVANIAPAGRIKNIVNNHCKNEYIGLIENIYIYKGYWNKVKEYLRSCKDRDESKEQEIQKNWKGTVSDFSEKGNNFLEGKDLNAGSHLIHIFRRLYVLRNQIMHGSSAWKDLNRDQVQDGCRVLESLIPEFIRLMLANQEKALRGEIDYRDWGEIPYPPFRAWDNVKYFLDFDRDNWSDLVSKGVSHD